MAHVAVVSLHDLVHRRCRRKFITIIYCTRVRLAAPPPHTRRNICPSDNIVPINIVLLLDVVRVHL